MEAEAIRAGMNWATGPNVQKFERMLRDIGNVNMKALEIYDKAQSEYEELLKKKDKLRGEREDVLVMINEIDSKKKELFMRTYDVLNDNFKISFISNHF